jgi:predicted small metal-binding protein
MDLTCRQLGVDCDHVVSGETVDLIVESMQSHAVEGHDYSATVAHSDEMVAAMRNAVRQSTRPADMRTSEIRFTEQ